MPSRLPDRIETERLTLRRPRASDAGPMSLYAGDRRVAEMLEHGGVPTFRTGDLAIRRLETYCRCRLNGR